MTPTCYIQTLLTGECATRPVDMEPSLRGVAPTANGPVVVPGGICGWNTSNAHIPCGGGSYCTNESYGFCTKENALDNPSVSLYYYK